MKHIKSVIFTSALLININNAGADNAEDRNVYIGFGYGFSEPAVKEFSHTSDQGKATMRLKQSKMFEGRIGYSFYPNMSIELSGTHQPKYRMSYKLPSTKVTDQLRIPSTTDIVDVSSNVVTLNLIYELEKMQFGIKPYVIFGAGIAQLRMKQKITSATLETNNGVPFLAGGKQDFFRIDKKTRNYLACQFGGGISYDLTNNFAVDLGAKLQVIKDAKIYYSTKNTTTKLFESQKPIKQSIGVGEFTVGFTYKIPIM